MLKQILSNIFKKYTNRVEMADQISKAVLEQVIKENDNLKEEELIKRKVLETEVEKKSPLEKSTDYILQGDKFKQIEDFRSAISYYEKSIDILQTPIAYLRLAAVLSELDDYKNALIYSEKALELDDKNWMAYNNIAICKLKEKKIDEAILYAKEAVDLSKESIAYYNFGFILENNKDYMGAMEQYANAIQKNKDNFNAIKSFIRLQSFMN